MFFLLMYFALMSLSSLPIWRDEQRIFTHDRASGVYGTTAYFTASVLFDLIPYRIIPPCIFTGIVFPMVKLSPSAFTFLSIITLYNLVMSTACMFIGIVTGSNAVANAWGGLLVLFSLLFAGYLENSGSIPASWEWMQTASASYYAFNALLVNEFTPLDDLYVTTVIGEDAQSAGPFTGRDILNCFGYGKESVAHDIAVLGVMLGFCLLLAVSSMALFLRESR